jgi:SIT family siderophore-iron:H+ symporter-like MFS transporter
LPLSSFVTLPSTDHDQINTWVSGDVSQAVLDNTNWRWGIGMWCIIYTVCSIPLIASLMWSSYKARKAGALDSFRTPYQMYGGKNLFAALFWQLDVPGIVLLIAVFGCILTVRVEQRCAEDHVANTMQPFTIAGGEQTQWGTAKVIAPLVIGILCVPVFVIWERKAPHPMLPFHVSHQLLSTCRKSTD